MTEKEKRLYLERIGFDPAEAICPDAETLIRLHRLHTMTIPYENTDYLTGHILSTAYEIQFHEVIECGRGGMCIDLNPLFGSLLTELGYHVRYAATRMCQRAAEDLNFHVVMAVKDREGGVWWCDVASPVSCFPEPVPLLDGHTVEKPWDTVRTERTGKDHWILSSFRHEHWVPLFETFQWDIRPGEDTDRSKFTAPARYPDNAVLCKEVFSLPTPSGRRTLTGNIYRESGDGVMTTTECAKEMMPWAYDKFGLDYQRITEKAKNRIIRNAEADLCPAAE